MNEIPQHTRWLIERLFGAYCARVCPPTARHVVLLGFEIHQDRVIVVERRRLFGITGMMRTEPVAAFRYRALDQSWSLYARGEAGRWQRHPHSSSTRNLLQLLRLFDIDPLGLFWGRIDGKSLRWCSAKGRCIACESQYRAILGVGESIADPQAESVNVLRVARR